MEETPKAETPKMKSEESFLDKLKSWKRWIAFIVGALPIVAMLVSKNISTVDGIQQIVTGLLVAMGILGAEDIAKHLRDGKIVEAKSRQAFASSIEAARKADPR